MAHDPMYDTAWKEWILTVRRQIGLVELADLIYVRSQYYWTRTERQSSSMPELTALFGEKEGRIALANRRKDPVLLFNALQRHLNYPVVPRLKPADEAQQIIPQLARRVERLEARVKLMDDEMAGGLDISRFFVDRPAPPDHRDSG